MAKDPSAARDEADERHRIRLWNDKVKIHLGMRQEAIRTGKGMAMLDKYDNIIIVSQLSSDRFRTFLAAGDKAPRLNEKIRHTNHVKGGFVSTIFFGLPLKAGKWYETYRKHGDTKKKVFSATLEEAKKAHDQLMME